ncbi:hemolymph juvenile hormone binding [Trinorchestia longiramus]|nr:hemolymph juvenile hormone binding [Trinorchestia longiramus]
MTAALTVFVSLLVFMQVYATPNLPELIQNCRLNHLDKLNECLVTTIMQMRPQMAKGIPELNLPPLDPHVLKPLEFIQSEGPVQVRALYDQLVIHGGSKFDLKYFDWHFKQKKLFMSVLLPSLLIKGRYNITGMIFALPIDGNGAYTTLLKGIAVDSDSNLVVREDGALKLKDFQLNFKIQNSQTKMDNLFSGNKILSDTMHKFLNENDELIIQEIRPALQRQFSDLLGAIIKATIDSLPPESTSNLENESTNDKHRKRTNEIQAAQKRAQS